MSKIEQVKGWLKLINEFPIDHIAERICSLFEQGGETYKDIAPRPRFDKVYEEGLANMDKEETPSNPNIKTVAKLYLNDPSCKGAHLILDNLNLEDCEPLESFEVGDVLTVRIEEMNKMEFETLPEFDGW